MVGRHPVVSATGIFGNQECVTLWTPDAIDNASLAGEHSRKAANRNCNCIARSEDESSAHIEMLIVEAIVHRGLHIMATIEAVVVPIACVEIFKLPLIP